MSRNIVRKSDIGAPPARMSAGAPPSLPVRRVSRATFKNPRHSATPNRRRRAEGNLDTEEDSDSDQASTTIDEQEDRGSGTDEIKKEEEQEEKVKKTPRKKRRFRQGLIMNGCRLTGLTDSIAKSRKRAERRAQLAAERKEREESQQKQEQQQQEQEVWFFMSIFLIFCPCVYILYDKVMITTHVNV
ncbi:unnamed protein product [Gongylonema pulchrum]|uniref:Uncharacterized protein n=1 Tax=Gongylonema pulchrum TaxID=637853 RepID=A0A183CY10_9BILA|nr:unnamed protein product [Gongylonema pulchrum]